MNSPFFSPSFTIETVKEVDKLCQSWKTMKWEGQILKQDLLTPLPAGHLTSPASSDIPLHLPSLGF